MAVAVAHLEPRQPVDAKRLPLWRGRIVVVHSETSWLFGQVSREPSVLWLSTIRKCSTPSVR